MTTINLDKEINQESASIMAHSSKDTKTLNCSSTISMEPTVSSSSSLLSYNSSTTNNTYNENIVVGTKLEDQLIDAYHIASHLRHHISILSPENKQNLLSNPCLKTESFNNIRQFYRNQLCAQTSTEAIFSHLDSYNPNLNIVTLKDNKENIHSIDKNCISIDSSNIKTFKNIIPGQIDTPIENIITNPLENKPSNLITIKMENPELNKFMKNNAVTSWPSPPPTAGPVSPADTPIASPMLSTLSVPKNSNNNNKIILHSNDVNFALSTYKNQLNCNDNRKINSSKQNIKKQDKRKKSRIFCDSCKFQPGLIFNFDINGNVNKPILSENLNCPKLNHLKPCKEEESNEKSEKHHKTRGGLRSRAISPNKSEGPRNAMSDSIQEKNEGNISPADNEVDNGEEVIRRSSRRSNKNISPNATLDENQEDLLNNRRRRYRNRFRGRFVSKFDPNDSENNESEDDLVNNKNVDSVLEENDDINNENEIKKDIKEKEEINDKEEKENNLIEKDIELSSKKRKRQENKEELIEYNEKIDDNIDNNEVTQRLTPNKKGGRRRKIDNEIKEPITTAVSSSTSLSVVNTGRRTRSNATFFKTDQDKLDEEELNLIKAVEMYTSEKDINGVLSPEIQRRLEEQQNILLAASLVTGGTGSRRKNLRYSSSNNFINSNIKEPMETVTEMSEEEMHKKEGEEEEEIDEEVLEEIEDISEPEDDEDELN